MKVCGEPWETEEPCRYPVDEKHQCRLVAPHKGRHRCSGMCGSSKGEDE